MVKELNRPNSSLIAYEAIEECLAQGMEDKIAIYDKVEADTGIARPTIRQSAAKLKADYEHLVQCLVKKNTAPVHKSRKEIKEEYVRY